MANSKTINWLTSSASVGALAISSLIPSVASAQQAGAIIPEGPKDMTLSFEGGAAFSDFTSDFFAGEEKFGSFDDDLGLYGSIAFSKSVQNDWDWRVSASHLGFPNNSSFEAFVDGEFDVTTSASGKFNATTVDFDMGRNWRRGQTDTRLGFGLVGGRVNQTFDKGFTVSNCCDVFGTDGSFDSSFLGFGPKLSASISHRVQPRSPFRLIAGASVAPMVGNYTHEKGFSIFDEVDLFSDSISETDRGTLLMTSAFIGMAYDFSEDSSLRVGIRADHFDSGDVDTFFGSDGLFEDTLATTAFVGVDIKF